MLREALTALHAELNVVEVRGYDTLATGARPSKLVKPVTPKIMAQLELPKITVEMYDMRQDPGRAFPGQWDILGDQYVQSESFDTTEAEFISAVNAPEPWLLFFQVELLSFRHHDEIEMIEQVAELISDAKDIDVSYSIAGITITWPCRLQLVDTQHSSTGKNNEFEGRIIFSYSLEAWKWPTGSVDTIPLIAERIIRRGASDTEPDEEEYDYVKNLDT